jgi:transmembrane 9 superfamily protein 3
MYLDDLPIWGIVGEMENSGQDLYLWTHKKFEIGYSGHNVSFLDF